MFPLFHPLTPAADTQQAHQFYHIATTFLTLLPPFFLAARFSSSWPPSPALPPIHWTMVSCCVSNVLGISTMLRNGKCMQFPPGSQTGFPTFCKASDCLFFFVRAFHNWAVKRPRCLKRLFFRFQMIHFPRTATVDETVNISKYKGPVTAKKYIKKLQDELMIWFDFGILTKILWFDFESFPPAGMGWHIWDCPCCMSSGGKLRERASKKASFSTCPAAAMLWPVNSLVEGDILQSIPTDIAGGIQFAPRVTF